MTEKKETSKCDNCKKYQDKAFELEVDEDLQQERLNRFWKKYRWIVYGAVVLILGITAGTQLYQTWRNKIRLEESDAFENAVIQIFSQKPDVARPVLLKLAAEGRTGYRYLARIELAGLAARQNDVETALKEFEVLLDSDAPQSLKNIALLSYVGLQVDTGDAKDLLQKLEPLQKDVNFIGTTMELVVSLYLKDGQPEQAKQALQAALQLPNLPEEMKAKLNGLIQIIGE